MAHPRLHPRRLAAALVPVFLVLASGCSGATTPAAERRAERSLAADLYVARTGSDGGSCTRQRPCRTFARALERASPGDVVEVRGGRYPGQTLEAGTGPGRGKKVVFRPARGARVVLGGPLVVAASRVELRDLAAPVWKVEGGRSITLRRLDVNAFFIHGGRDIRVIGGDVGPSTDVDPQITSGDDGPPRRVRISGVRFHDMRKADPETHIECLQIGSGIDVTIVRSRFEDCADHGLFVRSWASAGGVPHPLDGFLIEGNTFDKPLEGTYALRLAPTDGWECRNFVIRRNVALSNMYSDCDADGVLFVGNAQPTKTRHSCSRSRGARWNGNLYGAGFRCGPKDRVSAADYRDVRRAVARGVKAAIAALDLRA